MPKFILSFALLLVLSIFILLPCVFSQEDITITTYYPSPNGVYTSLRASSFSATRANIKKIEAGEISVGGEITANDITANDIIAESVIATTSVVKSISATTIVAGGVNAGSITVDGSINTDTLIASGIVKVGGDLNVEGSINVKGVWLRNPKSGRPRWVSQPYSRCNWLSTSICSVNCVVRGVQTIGGRENPRTQIFCCCQ